MPKIIINNFLLWIMIGSSFPASLACQGDRMYQRMKELSNTLDVQINLYGRVLDQHGLPVEGADVLLGLTRFSPNPRSFFTTVIAIHAKTDTQGFFSIQKEKGRRIFIGPVEKKGFEYSREQNPNTSFHMQAEFVGDPDPRPLISDPKNPLVLHVRKMGETAFLVKHPDGCGFGFENKESGIQKGYDLIQNHEIKEKDMAKPVFNGDPLFCDLKAKAIFDPKIGTWMVILSPGNASGGIMVSDKLLYEAPAEGYQTTYTFSFNRLKPVKGKDILFEGRYFYLRSREPAIYTRLKLSDIGSETRVTDSGMYLGLSAVTNPYGDRNLERVTDLPGDVDVKLSNEVRESYRLNRRPPKPDLQKLIQESEKKKPLLQRLFKN